MVLPENLLIDLLSTRSKLLLLISIEHSRQENNLKIILIYISNI
jgi:hypothetical protein